MKTTFSRLFSAAATILLVALLLLGTIFQLLIRDFLETNTTDKLTNDARTIAGLAAAYNAESSLANPNFLANLTIASQIAQADAVICNVYGEVVMCSDAPLGCEHQGSFVNQEYIESVIAKNLVVSTGIIKGLYDDQRYVVSVPIVDMRTGDKLGIVMTSAPTQAMTDVLWQISRLFLFVALLVVLIAVVVMIVFARRHSHPLRDMAKVARDFGHGNLTVRAKVDDGDTQEMQELALAFNNMASSLQKSENQRGEFVANVSHELKTPMTTIGGYVDGILDGTIPPQQQQKYLSIVSGEVKRLSRLVRSMLEISRLQSQEGFSEDQLSRVNLEECAGQVLITFEKKIVDKNLTVDVKMPDHPVFIRANQDAVTQIIYNLVDNAVKFCPQDGKLGLKIQESSNKAYVSVSNNGPVIPPGELPLIFDRFHKTDKSRSQNRDGWGLGLYIVKTLVCSHGENISVTSREDTTEFTFTMPLVN